MERIEAGSGFLMAAPLIKVVHSCMALLHRLAKATPFISSKVFLRKLSSYAYRRNYGTLAANMGVTLLEIMLHALLHSAI
jgi:hypothetical protein